MTELYWLALTRDVAFREYGAHPLIQAAVADLNACSAPVAPKWNGRITAQTIFRGETTGDLIGPYLSQFFWRAIPYGVARVESGLQDSPWGGGGGPVPVAPLRGPAERSLADAILMSGDYRQHSLPAGAPLRDQRRRP